MSYLAPPCPQCGRSIPFKQTLWGLGKTFSCYGCGAQLVIPKNFWIGIGAFIAFWMLRRFADSGIETAGLVLGLVVMTLIFSRLFLLPSKA